ncbi:MAG: hypothetical protein HUU31_18675 [Anaerolineae bacterium]|nr:hypothetical protein [Anaerolineae bacterium]
MNPLMDAYAHLAHALAADPLLRLAATVATLDPFWAALAEGEIDYETDPLTIALHVTRGAFPDIYAEAGERLRAGAGYAELDRLICRAITARGIPLDDLEAMSWGVPLNAWGVDLEDPEFYAVHADLLPLLAPFGLRPPEEDAYRVDVPTCVYPAGGAIAASLLEQTEPALRQVGWAFGWLFSCNGNSLVDCTDEGLAEIPPLSWSPDDIAFAIELIAEAEGIMRDVRAGIDTLQGSPDLMAALMRNVAILYRELKKKGVRDIRHFRLAWAADDGTTKPAGDSTNG